MASRLYYALVARNRVILCDGGEGGYEQSSQRVVEGLDPSVTMISYETSPGSYVYHVMVANDLTFVCVADALFDRQVAFAFLQELDRQIDVTGLREKFKIGGPYSLRREFASVIDSQLQRHSSGDKLSHMHNQVKEVHNIMTENIEKVVHRGEAIDDLSDRSNLLAQSSTDFRHSSNKLRKKLFWKNIKMWVILIIVLLVILLVIVAVILIALAATGHFKKK